MGLPHVANTVFVTPSDIIRALNHRRKGHQGSYEITNYCFFMVLRGNPGTWELGNLGYGNGPTLSQIVPNGPKWSKTIHNDPT